MTSRQLSPPANSVVVHHRRHSHLLFIATAIAFPSIIFLFLMLLFLYLYFSHYFSHCRSPALPFDSPLPSRLRRFSHRELHATTSGFAASRFLGRGASAAVFLGILADGKSVAIKCLDPLAPSSDNREFLNELRMLSNLHHSDFVVSLLGYCFEGNHRRLLVYEYMSNGSLQELFFGPRRPLVDWSRRFQIILDLAKAITFLHLNHLIIHGDIKPSNVLLGDDFRAKISDFGLSRLKTETTVSTVAELFSQELLSGNPRVDIALPIHPSSSPSFLNHEKNARLVGKEAAVNPCDNELGCIENNNDFQPSSPLDDERDWRWKKNKKSEHSKDYVIECIGRQIFPANNLALDEVHKSSLECKNQRFEEGANGCNKRDSKIREWWKEESYEEVSKKEKGNKRLKYFETSNSYHRDDTELNVNLSIKNGWKNKKSRSVSDEMSSGELSSNRSVRGTVCYIAPECNGCGNLTEKVDIYSFGVLILVIVSGRRPLHVLESPMKLGRANLISWCRKLAQRGNVLDIVDENLKDSYNKDQVRLCINVALLCLQRIPDLRPDSLDIVKVLEGEK